MRIITAVIVMCCSNVVGATDLLRSGSDAEATGKANILGLSADPLSAVNGNPALMAGIGNQTRLSLSTLWVDSRFISKPGERSTADRGPGIVPEFALVRQIADSGWSWGAGLAVGSAMRADFDFVDPAGTGGVSYGRQTHRSEFLIAKASGALAYAVNDALSLGISLGAAYNRNELEAPYIFQSHPVLKSLKVLVDLEADDLALTSTIGLDYTVNADWKFNLAYTLETEFSADGNLSGNLGQLGLGIQPDFRYEANVKTALPASLNAGVRWQASNNLVLGVQYDWIRWEQSFDDLPISLTNGTNADLNAFLGSNSIADTAPLDWHNQHVWHIAGEYLTGSGRKIRVGIERSNVIVPRATVTPMTAAILDTALSVGTEFTLRDSPVDIAYRLSSGSDLHVGTSRLEAGEYSGTRQSLRLHTLAISFAF